MSRSKMLIPVDGDRPFFGGAGANAIGALCCLGPHGTEPNSPMLETARIGVVGAVLDHDTRPVAEEQRVSGRANQVVKAVDLVPCAGNEVFNGLTEISELVGCQDARRLVIDGIDAVLGETSLPGV